MSSFSVPRVSLHESVRICTFSRRGATADSLVSWFVQVRWRQLDFVVLYIGGNNLTNGLSPHDAVASVLISSDQVKVLDTAENASTCFTQYN